MHRWGWVGVLVLGLVFGVGQDVAAQEDADDRKIRLFFDCQAMTMACFDPDFYRREITWVDWVLDRTDSDVHLLVTMQRSGGGLSFFLAFIGVGEFEGQDSNLTAFSSATDTDDERRGILAAKAKLGLAPYAAETSAGARLSVVYDDPTSAAGGAILPVIAQNDPWNLWVFNVGLGGSMSAESRFSNANVNANLGANRVSDQWKFSSGASFRYRESDFEISDEETVTSFTRSMGATFLLVKSLGPQWGIGGRGSVSSSTFANQDIRFTLVPAVEFNLFPYSESSRRSITFQYRVGPEYVRYDEKTVFDKTEEWLYSNTLTASLGMQQPWGGASFSLSGSAFLDDFQKNSLSTFGNVNFRITRGLDLNFGGRASRIRNRINLPGSEASEQDILLRQIILDTSFSFRFNVGLSYRFGSIFNNIVNPRFDGGSFFFF